MKGLNSPERACDRVGKKRNFVIFLRYMYMHINTHKQGKSIRYTQCVRARVITMVTLQSQQHMYYI